MSQGGRSNGVESPPSSLIKEEFVGATFQPGGGVMAGTGPLFTHFNLFRQTHSFHAVLGISELLKSEVKQGALRTVCGVCQGFAHGLPMP